MLGKHFTNSATLPPLSVYLFIFNYVYICSAGMGPRDSQACSVQLNYHSGNGLR